MSSQNNATVYRRGGKRAAEDAKEEQGQQHIAFPAQAGTHRSIISGRMSGSRLAPGMRLIFLRVLRVAFASFALKRAFFSFYYRLENWKLRRALALPYFLRSTTRLSRVRKPPCFKTGPSPGS